MDVDLGVFGCPLFLYEMKRQLNSGGGAEDEIGDCRCILLRMAPPDWKR